MIYDYRPILSVHGPVCAAGSSLSLDHGVWESTKYYYSLVPGRADSIEAQTDEDAVVPEGNYEKATNMFLPRKPRAPTR